MAVFPKQNEGLKDKIKCDDDDVEYKLNGNKISYKKSRDAALPIRKFPCIFLLQQSRHQMRFVHKMLFGRSRHEERGILT